MEKYKNDTLDASEISPLGLITSAHEPEDRADDSRSVDSDPGDARDGLDVYVALGSHATYLTPGEHDFFSLANLFRKEPALFALGIIALTASHPLLLPLLLIHSHFKDTKDITSEEGVTGQRAAAPAGADPETHLPMELVVTPLSDIDDSSDSNIYDLGLAGNPEALALRAFRGRLGNHNGFIDESPKWENKTRRYFEELVAALRSGKFRDPSVPIIG